MTDDSPPPDPAGHSTLPAPSDRRAALHEKASCSVLVLRGGEAKCRWARASDCSETQQRTEGAGKSGQWNRKITSSKRTADVTVLIRVLKLQEHILAESRQPTSKHHSCLLSRHWLGKRATQDLNSDSLGKEQAVLNLPSTSTSLYVLYPIHGAVRHLCITPQHPAFTRLSSARITSVCHLTQFMQCWESNPRLAHSKQTLLQLTKLHRLCNGLQASSSRKYLWSIFNLFLPQIPSTHFFAATLMTGSSH